MALPDFLVIGAMKCGTSTLAAQLSSQDGIFVCDPKEPNFFSDDPVHARGLGWYESLFAAAGPGDLKGDASTHYTKRPTHPCAVDRAARVLPAPRLIYLIRNPVDRAVSHFLHDWSQGEARGDLDAAIEAAPGLVDYGRFGFQIAPWVEAFGAEAICLVSLERMQADPQSVLDRVCAHIGYRGAPRWSDEASRVNASAERVRRFPFHDLLIDGTVATTLRRTLVPKAVRSAIRRSRQPSRRPEMSPATRQRLERIFLEDRETLRRWFPDAGALAESYPFAHD